MTGWRGLSGTVAAIVCATAMGCGGGGADPPSTTAATGAATSLRQLTERFSQYTGLNAELRTSSNRYLDDSMRVDPADDAARRLGGFRVEWAEDATEEAGSLDRTAGPNGWYVSEDGNSLAKPFGRHAVLRGYDFDEQPGLPADLLAAERAVRAANAGRPELLPAAERACKNQHLTPLRGPTGACAVDGVPTTFVDATTALRTEALGARVTGVEIRDTLGETSALPQKADPGQTFVVVAYRVHNRTKEELFPGHEQLRVGDRTYESDLSAGYVLARPASTIEPGATVETVAAFPVDRAVAVRARAGGALVLATGLRTHGVLQPELAQGWIRLARAPSQLPKLSGGAPPAPAPAPQPTGPPDIPVEVGSGPEIGSAARSAYHASMFFPVPANFRPGGVTVGTRAGPCQVPRPTDEDREQIRQMAATGTPDRVVGIFDRSLLLAECDKLGDFGIVFWTHVTPKGKRIISGVEIIRRDGRWVENKGRFYPGCTIPLDAAAAWQLDVSACPKNAPRPEAKGDLA